MEFNGAPTGYDSFDNKSKVILEENSKLIYSNDNNNFFIIVFLEYSLIVNII